MKDKRKKIVRVFAMGTSLAMALSMSACQKNPDSSIVVNKDMDNLIEEAQNTESGTVNIGEAVGNYETYQTQLSDESLHVSVNVDAKVDIPETEQLSVIRVKQNAITQETVDNIVNELMSGETLYDGSVTEVRTKEEIEAEIRVWQDDMNNASGEEFGNDEESLQVYQSECQSMIDSLQQEYESASSAIDWENYKSDGQLHSVQELYNRNPEDSYYSWQYDLNPNGSVLYAVTNADAAQQKKLYVQNNEDYGNCIRYMMGNVSDTPGTSVYIESSNLEEAEHHAGSYNIWKAEEEIPAEFSLNYGLSPEEVSEIQDVSSAPTTMPVEQAVGIADEFLTNVGIEGFEYYCGGKYSEACLYKDSGNVETWGYQTYYVLQYMRNIDGAFVTFDNTAKHEEGWSGDDYVKKTWPVECIEFRINDDGIVAFYYSAPIETTETVVEQSAIKSFEEVRGTFEQMILITNASEEEGESLNIDVDRVVLGYARISEADSYDTGLLVPVWDFKGTVTYEYGNSYSDYGSVMTINAIDGSVIDRSIGY